MIIGVDVDEVLTKFVDTYLSFYNKVKGTSWKREDIQTYYFYEVFGISKEEDTKSIIDFGKTKEYSEMPLVDGAVDGIFELKKKWFEFPDSQFQDFDADNDGSVPIRQIMFEFADEFFL